MKIKDLVTTVTNYKECGLLVAFPTCTFKCCKDGNFPISVCQNSEIAKQKNIEISAHDIISNFYEPTIHHALILGGLEPLDSIADVLDLCIAFRKRFNDTIVIYTGYYPNEVVGQIKAIRNDVPNVIVKFGRYIPNVANKYDEILGVHLASDNQSAFKIS